MYLSSLADLLPYRNQSRLEAKGVLLRSRVLGELGGDASPIAKNGDRVGIDLAVVLVDSGEVDLADKVNDWRLLGVVGAALHLKFVDAILVVTLQKCDEARLAWGFTLQRPSRGEAYVRGTPNGSSPVCHENILRVLETVRTGACRQTSQRCASGLRFKWTPKRTGTHALLALLQLSKELKVAGNLRNRHGE